MSAPPGESHPVPQVVTAAYGRESTALAIRPVRAVRGRPAPEVAPFGPPVVRLLTVRDVAAALQVSTATLYALVERGELAHVRVSNSIRVAPVALQSYLARAGR